jgi:hypothetical protein
MPDFSTPFRVGGPCIALLGSSGNTANAALINQTGDWTAIISNRSTTVDAYLGYGATSGVAASAVVPVIGAMPSDKSQNVVAIPHSTVQSFTFAGPTFFSVIVPPASQAILDIVTGDGS